MDTPWSAYMHIGLVEFMMYPGDMAGNDEVIEGIQRVAADPFFDVLEITRIKNPAIRQQVRDIADMAHMDLGFGAQPPLLMGKLNTAALDEDARRAAVAEVKTCIDQAYEHGCRLLAMIDGLESWPGEAQKERALDQVTKSLDELCEYAEQQAKDYLLTISLETFDRSIEKKSLLGPTRDAASVARRVKDKHQNFGLTIDLSHIPLLGETIRESLTEAQDFLIHAHVGNCQMQDPNLPSYGDKHPRFGAPLGENDARHLSEFLNTLMEIGFFEKELPTRRPVVTFEVRPLPGEHQDILLANCRRVFEEAWAAVKGPDTTVNRAISTAQGVGEPTGPEAKRVVPGS